MTARARHSTRRVTIATALALLPLSFLQSCSSSDDPVPPASFAVTATPAVSTFAGPTIEVSLTIVGKTAPDPVLHYTTDFSTPTAASPVYAGPFTISDSMIVKAIGINPDTSETPVLTQSYTLVDNPFAEEWYASGHGNVDGEAFRHWDDDGSVPASCARCHGDGGLRDFADNGVVDTSHPIAMGHGCEACHEPVPVTLYDGLANYPALRQVEFPSLATASLEGPSNLCIACHQGRESGLSVDDDIAATPGGPYNFINIHYYAAAATLFGAETNGGYQYAGMQYAGRNSFASHEADQQSCVGCHMRGDRKDHTLEPLVSDCNSCHTGSTFASLSGSPANHSYAITVSIPQLMSTVQAYAADTLGFPIIYDSHAYPYFFNDTNGNGIADPDEVNYGNRYTQFDASLLKGAYNYQVAAKDPAGYIHNGVYMRQLLHDSIDDLGGTPSVPAPGRTGFNMALATKSEQWHTSGHGDSTAEAFRHWDDDGAVPNSCARCHSSTGFEDYIGDGVVSAAAPLGETVGCLACHNSTNLFADDSTRFDNLIDHAAVEPVLFPSGDTGTFNDASNLCMSCHQGRSSGLAIDAASPNSTVQAPTNYDSFSFINRHYYAAGAIMFGADVSASYEYAGNAYAGFNTFAGHNGNNDSCLSCHMRSEADHSFLPQVDDCSQCHLGIAQFEDLGLPDGVPDVDYDGNGLGESFDAEILGTCANLYAIMQTYAVSGLPQSSPIIYVPGSYPYWFKDTNGDGVLTPGENSYSNSYKDFDRELLRAAYNYHSAQDPCGDIHNYKYVLQSVYDSADKLDNGALDDSVIGTRP